MLKNIQNNSNPIGSEKIYLETQDASTEIMKIFGEHQVSPLLESQTQQGKTAVEIAVADAFIKTCKFNGETYQVIVLVAIGDNVLRDQTSIRFRDAQLKEVEVYHLGNLNKIVDKNKDRVLFILDEIHLAIGKDKPLDTTLSHWGVDYGNPTNLWTKQNTYVLSVSATPYATVIRKELDDLMLNPSFKRVQLKTSPLYYSLQHIIDADRLCPSQPLSKDDKPTQYLKDIIKWGKQASDDHPNGPGFHIIRCRGEDVKIVEKYCLNHIPQIDTEIYSCKKNEQFSISQLDSNIGGHEPPEHCVVIISGALRVGKTLTTTKNIRRWSDSPNVNSDTGGQSVGRCTGYKDKYGHSKFDDTFKIDCDIDAIKLAADFYKGNNPTIIPKGNNNSSNVKKGRKRQYTSVIHVFDTQIDAVAKAKTIYGHLPLWQNKYQHPTTLSHNGMGVGKGGLPARNPNDVAQAIINGTSPSTYEVIWNMDKPSPRFQQSGDELFNIHPEYKGKYIVMEKIKIPSQAPTKVLPLTEIHIKEKSLLSN